MPILKEVREKDKILFSKRMKSSWMKKGLVFGLLLLLAGWPGCRVHSASQGRAIRLLDILSARNIVLTPYQREGMSREKEFEPIDCPSLEREEAGENPYGIKRRLHLGAISLAILFAPPKSRYSIELDLPPDGILEFGIGIVRDRNFALLEEKYGLKDKGVEFLVEMEMKGRKRTIFQKFLEMPEEEAARTVSFSLHRVALPAQGGKGRLSFITEASQGAFSFWYSPVIISQKKEHVGVILISLDTLRADHLGCYGYDRATSPAIDGLAAESAVFLHPISSSSWTLPAHVSLLTAADPPRHGVVAADDRMPSSLLTLPQVLSRHGFFCGAITGGGFLSHIYGFARGFDFYNESDGSLDYENSAELVARAAERWLEDNLDKDFFLFLHTYQIHTPYAPPAQYRRTFLSPEAPFEELDMSRHLGGKEGVFRPLSEIEKNNAIALYDAEIRYTDEALIGRLVKWLKEKGVYDRIMLIVTSDHGEEFYEHGAWTHGPHLYQESLRVPLIIKFPWSRFQGKRIAQIVRLIDIAPTILESLGIKIQPNLGDGRSLLPLLTGKEDQDRVFLADTCWLSGEACGEGRDDSLPLSVATNRGKEKLIFNQAWPDYLQSLYNPKPAEWRRLELYNLEEDQAEKHDLSEKRPSEVREMVRNMRTRYRLLKKWSRLKVPLTEEQLDKLRALGYIH